LHPVFEDFHLLRMEGDYEYPRHQHTNYEVILVDRGPYRCELNAEQVTLVAGQVLIVKPGDWHQDHLRDGQRHYVLHFRLSGAAQGGHPPALFRQQCRPSEQICSGNYSRETFFLRELRREAEEKAPHGPAIQDSLLEALFWRISRGLSDASLSSDFLQLPRTDNRREFLAGIFHGHLKDRPTVQQMAREAGMSSSHFTTVTRQIFGMGPARFLLEFKLRRAEEMLRYRRLRVKEVSEHLGFANPYHFSRAFRRVLGRPPSLC
jgi:AraC-like DNA-binding protein